MKIIGIIAEYNPFHNGHAYQIDEIRERTHADYIIVAMSGDFVQRGTPAVIDKYARTKMALSCGADLVLELPVLWATSSAEYFAMAGVTLLEKTGCVDSICFGAETDDLPLFSLVADILSEEPETYRLSLSSYLKKGESFPSARAKAVCDYLSVTQAALCPASMDKSACADTPDNRNNRQEIHNTAIFSLLNEPNNILALEYLKALKRRHSSITPYFIKREGAGYHDVRIHDTDSDRGACGSADASGFRDLPSAGKPTASATAIRSALRQAFSFQSDITGKETHSSEISASHRESGFLSPLQAAMPASAQKLLEEYLYANAPVWTNDFSGILGYQLLSATPETLAAVGDCSRNIANRLFRNRHQFRSFEEFCEQNKSKDITYTRLNRILLHLILGIANDDYNLGKELDYIPYLRLLGFRKDAAPLLSRLKETAEVPILAKLADAPRSLSEDACVLLNKDIFAGELYRQVRTGLSDRNLFHVKSGPNSAFSPAMPPVCGSEFCQQVIRF